MKEVLRGFVSLWYLLGWLVHVYLGLRSPQTYAAFSSSILFPPLREIWGNWFLPNITPLALLLALFELVTGLLIINKGRWVRIGLGFSLAFNLFLLILGLAWPAEDGLSDFLRNRLPSLVFMALQLPLLNAQFNRSLPEVIGRRFFRTARS